MTSFLLPLASTVPTVDVLEALRNNDLLGWVCLVFLTILSIVGLTISFQKWFVIYRAKQQTEQFQRLVDGDGSWESLFMASKKYTESPIARLLKETYIECRVENWFDMKQDVPLENRLEIARTTVEGILAKTMSAEETRLISKLPWLATISTLAPFIGLFGTVWGVLASFQALGKAGSASIALLAPGISTALMTTIFGLIAAIPALVAYNYLMSEIHRMSSTMEMFSHEIENAVRKQILMEKGRDK